MITGKTDNQVYLIKRKKIEYSQNSSIYKKKIEELEVCEEKVAWFLNKYEHLRDCDKCLIFTYWKIIDKYLGEINHEKIHELTPAESITRARRFIQNELDLFPASDAIIDARYKCETGVREWSKNQSTLFGW